MLLRSKDGRHRITCSAAAIVGMLVWTTGCAAPANEVVENESVQNESQWTMPLDEFKIFNPTLSNYAEQLLIAKCLEVQGYEWPVPWQDTEFPLPETTNRTAMRIFNTEIAKRFGYHHAPPPNLADAVAWSEFSAFANSYSPDEGFRTRFLACGEDARHEQTLDGADGLNYIASLEIQAQDQIASNEAIREATLKWKSCLSEFVSFDLPNDPWSEMPTSEMAEKYSIYGPNATREASAEEISIAMADADCRVTSGYSSARYQAEWDAQLLLVKANRDKLDRIRNDAVAHTAELKNVIAENAPSR